METSVAGPVIPTATDDIQFDLSSEGNYSTVQEAAENACIPVPVVASRLIQAPGGSDLCANTAVVGRTHNDIITSVLSGLPPAPKIEVQLGPEFGIPPDVSPFKEYSPFDPSSERAPGAVNLIPSCLSVTSQKLQLPTNMLSSPPKDDPEYYPFPNECCEDTITELEVVGDVLRGVKVPPLEPPVVASLRPSCCSSHAQAVIARNSNLQLDMTSTLTATDNGKMVECYPIGRTWGVLESGTMIWRTAYSNYGRTAPLIDPAFQAVKRFELTGTKDIAKVLSCLSFLGDIDNSTSLQLIAGLNKVQTEKINFVRLYYRIWTLIFEAMAAEELGTSLMIESADYATPPQMCNTPRSLTDYLMANNANTKLFYLGHHTTSALGQSRVLFLLSVLLAEGLKGNFRFAVTKNWPSLGRVRLAYAAVNGGENLTVQGSIGSHELFELLQYYAIFLNQAQLVEEIGRTVASFLFRPVGDKMWYGHDAISLALPNFTCGQTIFFSFCLQPPADPVELKSHPFYKYAWVGAISYLQMSLCLGTAITNKEIPSRYAAAMNGISIDKDWWNNIRSDFNVGVWGPKINSLAQVIGRQLGWGLIFNRITVSIAFQQHNPINYIHKSKPIQWSDWLVFRSQVHEGTAFSALMGHLVPKYTLSSRRPYGRGVVEGRADASEVFYRILMLNHGSVILSNRHPEKPNQCLGYKNVPLAYNGMPIDGLFKRFGHPKGGASIPLFFLEDELDTHYVNTQWFKRIGLVWKRHALVPNKDTDPSWFLPTDEGPVDPTVIDNAYELAEMEHPLQQLGRKGYDISKQWTPSKEGYNTNCAEYFTRIRNYSEAAHEKIQKACIPMVQTVANGEGLIHAHAEEKLNILRTLAKSTKLAGLEQQGMNNYKMLSERLKTAWEICKNIIPPADLPGSVIGTVDRYMTQLMNLRWESPALHKHYEEAIRDTVDALSVHGWFGVFSILPFGKRHQLAGTLGTVLKTLQNFVPYKGEQTRMFDKMVQNLSAYEKTLSAWPALTQQEWAEFSTRPYPGERNIMKLMLTMEHEPRIFEILSYSEQEGDEIIVPDAQEIDAFSTPNLTPLLGGVTSISGVLSSELDFRLTQSDASPLPPGLRLSQPPPTPKVPSGSGTRARKRSRTPPASTKKVGHAQKPAADGKATTGKVEEASGPPTYTERLEGSSAVAEEIARSIQWGSNIMTGEGSKFEFDATPAPSRPKSPPK